MRFRNHRGFLNRNIHHNDHLQFAYNKYGREDFIYSVVEYCNENLLREREKYWIEFYNSISPEMGYNKVYPDDYKSGWKIQKKSPKRNCSRIFSINISTGERLLHKGQLDAADFTEVKVSKIWEICNYWKGNKGKRSSKGFIFVREDDFSLDTDYLTYNRKKVLDPNAPKKKYIRKNPQKKRNYKKDPKDIIPIEKRNLKRLKIRMLNKETGEEIIFNGALPMCKKYGFLKAKVFYCLQKPFKQRSHHGWWFEKIE